jgi:hypothetical protein
MNTYIISPPFLSYPLVVKYLKKIKIKCKVDDLYNIEVTCNEEDLTAIKIKFPYTDIELKSDWMMALDDLFDMDAFK